MKSCNACAAAPYTMEAEEAIAERVPPDVREALRALGWNPTGVFEAVREGLEEYASAHGIHDEERAHLLLGPQAHEILTELIEVAETDDDYPGDDTDGDDADEEDQIPDPEDGP